MILFLILIVSIFGFPQETQKVAQTIKLINNKLEIHQEFDPSVTHIYDYVVSHELCTRNDNLLIYKTWGISVYYKDISTKKTRLFSQIMRLDYVNETIIRDGQVVSSLDTRYDADFHPGYLGYAEDYIIERNQTAGFANEVYPWGALAFDTDGLVIYPPYSVQFGEPWSYEVSFKEPSYLQVYNITLGFLKKDELEGYVSIFLDSLDNHEKIDLQGTIYLAIDPKEGTVITNHCKFRGMSTYTNSKNHEKKDIVHFDHKIVSKLVAKDRPIPANLKNEL